MSSKTVALMGGAFDPVHRDHVYVADLCLKKGFCDEVWFMPSPDRWDKTINASPEDRFAMLEMATSYESRFILSDLEIRQGDYRGTYVFLKMMQERYPSINCRLLTGADSYETMPHWRDPLNFYGTEFNGELLMKEFELIVFARAGSAILSPEEHKAKGYASMFWLGPKEGFVGRYSSTEIRRSLLKNRGVCPEGLLPEIYRYIIEHDLYGA